MSSIASLIEAKEQKQCYLPVSPALINRDKNVN